MVTLQLLPNDYSKSLKNFEHVKTSLKAYFSNFLIHIEHIGSTALPSAITKPVLDILLIAKTAQEQKQIAALLPEQGYQPGELDKNQTKLFFSKLSPQPDFIEAIHLHLVYLNTPNSNDLISLKLREYLLQHPPEVELYNQEKLRLAKAGNYNRHFYTTHKEPYLKKLVAKVL